MIRPLFTAAAWVSLVLGIGAARLWARSYWVCESFARIGPDGVYELSASRRAEHAVQPGDTSRISRRSIIRVARAVGTRRVNSEFSGQTDRADVAFTLEADSAALRLPV